MTAKRYEAIFQQNAIAIQIYDRSGKCVEVNDAWEKLFASKKEDLEGYNVFEDPQVKGGPLYDCFMRAFNGEVIHVPPTYYDPRESGNEGRARWLESIFSPVSDDMGEVVEVAIIYTDITDLVRARDQMKAICDHVPEGILVQDENFKVLYVNPVATKLAGLSSPDDWTSKDVLLENHEYMTEDGKPFPLDQLPSKRALRGEVVPETIIKFQNKNTGEARTSAVIARAITNEKGVPYQAVSVIRDITDQLRIETQLRNSLEAQNLFFSAASHELRTPLTALKLNAQLMFMTYPNISMDSITKVDRQVTKLARLVDEMLDVSRISRGKLEISVSENVSLSGLTKDVLYNMAEQIKFASIDLSTAIEDNVIGRCDPERFEQVIENLITNAIRYASQSALFVKLSLTQGIATLEVCDQGPGIPSEDIDKIFNRYSRSRSFGERKGLGLGLYLVKEIVTLHGGKVSVSNLNTGGARFIIELPIR